MHSPPELPPEESWLPEAATSRAARFSLVWLVPLVAAIVAGWLVWTTLAEKGPVITITFRTGEGIEPGKTRVKYRDVEVGTVERVQIAADLSAVILTAQLVRGAERLLAADSRFWVVRPRVGVGGVSGLGTLVSGAFVEVDPGRSEELAYTFTGLEEPPPIRLDEPGRRFVLEARELGGIDRGSPVYYRDIEVGRVLGTELAPDAQSVDVLVFVREPFARLVTKDTRFWNASGLEVGTGSVGFYLRMQSVQALLTGGVAFDTPPSVEPVEPAEDGLRFVLFDSERSIEEAAYTRAERFLVYFDTSVRGLRPGSSVEFRGMPVGKVAAVELQFDPKTLDVRVPVLIDLQPERLGLVGEAPSGSLAIQTMGELVRRGLRARLESGNLFTGELVVGLDFYPNAAPAELETSGPYPVLPSVPPELEALTASLQSALERLAALPLDQLIGEARRTIADIGALARDPHLRQTIAQVDEAASLLSRAAGRIESDLGPLLASLRAVADQTARAAREAEATFAASRELLGPDSRLRYDVAQLMKELSSAARSIRLLADYLERNPQALIRGRGQ